MGSTPATATMPLGWTPISGFYPGLPRFDSGQGYHDRMVETVDTQRRGRCPSGSGVRLTVRSPSHDYSVHAGVAQRLTHPAQNGCPRGMRVRFPPPVPRV